MGTEEGTKESLPLKLKLAETSFKTVLDADVHLDNKASRVLSAMAFLTAAAAAIFAKVYSPTISTNALKQTLTQVLSSHVSETNLPSVVDSITQTLGKPTILIFGLDWSLLTFFGYMFFVLLGAVLYLAALGPTLNIPSWFQSESKAIKSLLFFELIACLKEQEWSNHWQSK